MASGAYRQYDVCESNTHQQVSSTGTGDPKTVTVPKEAAGMFITCATTSCRVTFDGTTPDGTHGIVVPAAAAPVFFPVGDPLTIKVCGNGGASTMDIVFLR